MNHNFYVDLSDIIEYCEKYKVPNDARIFYQRIEDSYFEPKIVGGKNFPEKKLDGWKTLKIESETYYNAIDYNKNVEKGQLVREGKLDKDEVGRYFWDESYGAKKIDLNDDKLLDQYIEASTIMYDREKNVLLITAHY